MSADLLAYSIGELRHSCTKGVPRMEAGPEVLLEEMRS